MGEANAFFFEEWDDRRPGERRSLDRARALLAALGLARSLPPVLTVVGSKGKGTAATYASAYLAAAGQRVVTVTSPSLRQDTERIRVDGAQVDEATLTRLGRRLAEARRRLPARQPGAGYLSPGGLFTLAGMVHAGEVDADYLVLEAGRGGASDEVSLVAPAVVAICPIFREHVDLLGGSLEAVVADKCGVVRETTRAVVMGPQAPATRALIRAALANRTEPEQGAPVQVQAVSGAPCSATVAGDLLPPGLGRDNARLGCLAARRLLPAPPRPGALAQVLRSVTLPGRLSVHRVPGTGTDLLVDAAVSRTGYAAAVAYAHARLGGFDHVLLSLPDDKDLAGAAAEFAGAPVTFVTVPASHLRYTRPLPAGWHTVPADQVDRATLATLGSRLIAIGTVSFVGHLLDLLDVATSATFLVGSLAGQLGCPPTLDGPVARQL